MASREFNRILDELLREKSIRGDPGMLAEMSELQREIIQAVKRSYKRLNK